ncbi:ABC transporter ATP-binding protein [Roseospira marina]|uniref:ABC transporter ATP-binding protein n=1 Tax=Roseospira marina TaxID=140057 RepID=A0A5M6IB89_9PROT|nr:ABC transporter ATP-binding protein [Roseospira marina]KAA5604989.1 ABC transporter ATP-binding protein [Roseospira marina]MBB4315006.1 peptide/nickel transport system ATP-binding protein [Roseospira marina]MBB5088006.1 peptide/nickel transport system ATP-binding protein [Roseospira marina]
MALLDIQDLTVTIPGSTRYAPPVRLLDGVSLTLASGGTLGLVGESGCGKSLTALAILGLLPDGLRAEGAIRLDGEDLLTAGERRLCALRGRRVAMIFQEPMTALNPVRTIVDQVAEGPRRHLRLSRRAAREHARAVLHRVGLDPSRVSPDQYPHALSGGQRQRVVIAIAVACGPALLVADEPTTALDVATQARILDLVRDLVQGEGMALLMISHDLGVIAETARDMAVMYAGQVVEAGPTARVLAGPRHPYTSGLMAARPQRAGQPGAPLPAIPGAVPPPDARPPGCPFADRCARADTGCRTRPPLGTGPDHRHSVACHHPLEASP